MAISYCSLQNVMHNIFKSQITRWRKQPAVWADSILPFKTFNTLIKGFRTLVHQQCKHKIDQPSVVTPPPLWSPVSINCNKFNQSKRPTHSMLMRYAVGEPTSNWPTLCIQADINNFLVVLFIYSFFCIIPFFFREKCWKEKLITNIWSQSSNTRPLLPVMICTVLIGWLCSSVADGSLLPSSREEYKQPKSP